MAAWAARRWLARNAAGAKLIFSETTAAATACTSLVLCLPALEGVRVCLPGLLRSGDLGCLLEALSLCPRLRALDLYMVDRWGDAKRMELYPATGCAPAFAKLRGLTKLALSFGIEDPTCLLKSMVRALVSLTGLADLQLDLNQSYQFERVPAALGQLKALRLLRFGGFNPCELEAGCLDLPNLRSLHFDCCHFCSLVDTTNRRYEYHMLPDVSALQMLTRIEFSESQAPLFLAQLMQCQKLQRIVLATRRPCRDSICMGLKMPNLPSVMGSLSSRLHHLDVSGHGFIQFPLALTQLAALQCLRAARNNFAHLPAAITALSRLTELTLGRLVSMEDPLQLKVKCHLDVRALGDLSSFPALRVLTFGCCEVLVCPSILNAVQHASLTSLSFRLAHPAPMCALIVVLLGTWLKGQGRGSVLSFVVSNEWWAEPALQKARGQAPFQKYVIAMQACGLF